MKTPVHILTRSVKTASVGLGGWCLQVGVFVLTRLRLLCVVSRAPVLCLTPELELQAARCLCASSEIRVFLVQIPELLGLEGNCLFFY